MKRIKLLVFMMLGMSCLFQSCKNELEEFKPEDSSSLKTKDYFFIKTSGGDVVSSFEPELLILIKKDLEKKKRISDASLLVKTYDFETGKMLSQFVEEANKSSKSLRTTTTDRNIALNVCVNGFWSNYITDVSWGFASNGHLAVTGGTTGESRAILGFSIDADMDGGYGLQYCVHRSNVGWEEYKNQNQYTNISNSSQNVEAFRIRVVRTNYYSPDKNYSVFYKSHVQDLGWGNWVGNDDYAGTVGQNRRCEAMAVGVFTY